MTQFYKECRACKGRGELRRGHPDASDVAGVPVPPPDPTKFPDYADGAPTRKGGMSGDVVADELHSLCGVCGGSGVTLD